MIYKCFRSKGLRLGLAQFSLNTQAECRSPAGVGYIYPRICTGRRTSLARKHFRLDNLIYISTTTEPNGKILCAFVELPLLNLLVLFISFSSSYFEVVSRFVQTSNLKSVSVSRSRKARSLILWHRRKPADLPYSTQFY
jgi:hypothetical protein